MRTAERGVPQPEGFVFTAPIGHSSITVTMDVYGHLFPSLTEALTERLDDVFRAARAAPSIVPIVAEVVPLPSPTAVP